MPVLGSEASAVEAGRVGEDFGVQPPGGAHQGTRPDRKWHGGTWGGLYRLGNTCLVVAGLLVQGWWKQM